MCVLYCCIKPYLYRGNKNGMHIHVQSTQFDDSYNYSTIRIWSYYRAVDIILSTGTVLLLYLLKQCCCTSASFKQLPHSKSSIINNNRLLLELLILDYTSKYKYYFLVVLWTTFLFHDSTVCSREPSITDK